MQRATTHPIDGGAEAGTTANNRLTSYLRFVSETVTDIAASSPSSSSSSLMKRDEVVQPELHFVLGNEAGDADSIISALCYAHALYSQRTNSLYLANNNNNDDDDDEEECSTTPTGTENVADAVIVVPIVSIPRSEIKLRPDVVRLLDLAGIDIRDLICIDDEFIISTLLLAREASSTTMSSSSSTTATSSPIIPPSKQRVCLILVDHNRLRSSLSHLSNNVIEILDHHEDELCYLATVPATGSGSGSGGSKRNIAFQDGGALVASTCTLVVERLFNITPTTSSSSSSGGDSRNRSCSTTASATETAAVVPATTIDANLGLLLLCVILLDSVNMNIDAGKGTTRDEFAISLLYRYTNWSSNNKVDDDDDNNNNNNNNNNYDDRTIATATIYPPNGCTNVPPNRDALFTYLQQAKFDNTFWYNLSVTDCFKLDYKRFTIPNMDSSSSSSSSISIGLSTVLISMNELLAKPNFYNELSSFVTTSSGGVDNTIDDEMLLLGIQTMTFSQGDDDDDGGLPIRGLLLASTNNSILESYTNYLITSEDAKFLEFTEIMVDDCDGGNDWWKKKKPEEDEECTTTTSNSNSEAAAGSISVRIFQQGNGKGSRKQVAPTLLKHASAKWGGGGV